MMNIKTTDEINRIDNSTSMTFEEGYELTKFYVNYFWLTKKFYSLEGEYEVDDVVQILMMKFMKHNHFEKYNNRITSKKYHIMNAVRTSMIDLLRKHREILSLDYETESGARLGDLIEEGGNDLDEDLEGKIRRDYIISQLPTESKSAVTGFSPLFNREVNLSFRMLALHMEAGFKAKDMAKFYINPDTHKSISEGTVSAYIRDMREYIIENVVVA